MEPELKQYEMLEPLCDRGHVVLVRSRRDGRLYVKKTLKTGDPLLYRELMASPVPGMPRIGEAFSDGSGLILIEE